MTESVPFPCLRLAGHGPSGSTSASKTSSKLHGNSLFREVFAPVERQATVEHSDVNARPVVTNDARRSRAEVGHVDRVEVPVVCAAGKVTLRIRICSCYIGERLDRGKLGAPGAQCNSIDLGEDVEHLPMPTKILKDAARCRLIEVNVNPDHLTLCLAQGSAERHKTGDDGC